MIDPPVDWFIALPVRWLTDPLMHRFIDSLAHWFIDSIPWFIDSLIHWFIASLIHWFIASLLLWFIDSLLHSTIDSLVGCIVASLVHYHWLIGSASDSLSLRSFVDSLIHRSIHSVSCGCFFHATSLASQSPLAHSLMHFTASTPLCFCAWRNLPVGDLLPIVVRFFPTFPPRGGPGTIWKSLSPLNLDNLVSSAVISHTIPIIILIHSLNPPWNRCEARPKRGSSFVRPAVGSVGRRPWVGRKWGFLIGKIWGFERTTLRNQWTKNNKI